jgi:hypothetical protein
MAAELDPAIATFTVPQPTFSVTQGIPGGPTLGSASSTVRLVGASSTKNNASAATTTKTKVRRS